MPAKFLPHCVAWSLLVLLFGLPATAQYSRLIGTVTDQDGKPVAGAKVEVHNPNNLPSTITETTDKKGKFTFGRLIDGEWRIVVLAEGFRPYQQVIEAVADEVLAPLKVLLERIAPATPPPPDTADQAARELFQRGVTAFRSGDYQAALSSFEEFKSLKPDSPEVELNLALAYQALQEYQPAIASYRAHLEHRPDHVEARVKLGECLVRSGDLEGALVQFQTALEKRPDDAMLEYNVGEILFSAERREEAVEHYSKAAELDPGLADAHLKLSFCLVALDRKTEALPHLNKYLELKPDAPNAEVLRGLLKEIESGKG
jgi:tetratricopeptide (TPR) repeat protein